MLEVLAGRNGSGYIEEMYNQIKGCLDQGEEDLILLVPEQYTLEAEKELMEVLELQGFFQLEVMGFNRLIDDLLDTGFESDKTVVTGTGKRMILKRILREQQAHLQVFGNMVDKPGFIEEVEQVLQQFKENMVEPDMLRQFTQNTSSANVLERKVMDLVLIFEAYQETLGKGFTDNELRIQEATVKAATSPRIQRSKIWIYGFHTFTNQVAHLVKMLAEQAKGVVLTLDLNVEDDAPDVEIFSINRRTLQSFQEMWAEGVLLRTFPFHVPAASDLDHLKQEFFAYPYRKWHNETPSIRVLQSQNVYREIDHMAMEIATLVQDEGLSYKDIGVVVNDLNGYGFPIQRTLEEFGIPCFLDAKRSMADKPLGLFVVSSLQILIHHYRYEDVFSMVKTGFSQLEEGEWETLENYCLQYGIRGAQWKDDFHKSDDRMTVPLETLNLYREKLVGPLENLRKKVRQAPTFASIARALYEYLKENQALEKTQAWTGLLQQSGDLDLASENHQVFNRIMELLDELVEVFGEERTTLRAFADILKEGIASSELGVLPSSGDEILIGDLKRTRQRSLSVLFLLGVNEGIWPGESEKVGIFTGQEGRTLEESHIPLFQDPAYDAVQEKYLFHQLLSKGKKRVYFSCAQADFEGDAMRPSFYLKRLVELFPKMTTDAKVQKDGPWITNARGSLRPMLAYFRHRIDQGELPDDAHWIHAYQWYLQQEPWKEKLKHATSALAHTNQVDKLSLDQVRGLYGKTIRNSVTSLETYSQCPFRYFVRYGLKPTERPIYEVSIPDMGELLHNALQEYTRRMQREHCSWVDVNETQRKERCSEIVEEKIRFYKEGIFASKGRYQYLGYYLNRLMLRAVETLTYHMAQGSFHLEKAEAVFGEKQEYEPMVFTYDDDVRMILEGRIDRVDLFRDGDRTYVKIIDYKTGEKTLSLTDVYHGLTLQLLVYLFVSLENTPGAEPAGAFYFKLDDPMVHGFSHEKEEIDDKIRKKLRLLGLLVNKMEIMRAMDRNLEDANVVPYRIKKDGAFASGAKGLLESDVFERMLAHSVEMARKMGDEIVQGHIAIAPVKNDGKTACRFCSYKTICQFDGSFEGNRYRIRQKLKDEEVISKLMGGKTDD